MLSRQISSLHFAVRLRVISRYTGQLLLVFAALTLITLLFSLTVGEYFLLPPYLLIIIIAAGSGFILQRIHAPADMQRNEALVISAVVFCFAPLLLTPVFHRAGLPLADALFEAVSGITTTGLSTLPTTDNLPATFLFSRAWLQWTGGLGIVVLSVAIVLPQTRAAMRLFQDNWERDLISSTRSFARIILRIYLILTLAGIAALLLAGVPWLDSLVHILAAVSTGGFSSHDRSLAGMGWMPQSLITLFSFLGAVSFAIYSRLLQKNRQGMRRQGELLGLIVLTVLAVVAVSLLLAVGEGLPLREALHHGPLLAISAQTTTGFSSLPVSGLSEATKTILILLMLVGGNIGSTAGGIKVLRLLILLHLLRLLVIRSGMPGSSVIRPRFMGRDLDHEEIERCLLLILLFLLVIGISWLIFIFCGYPALDSLFEVVSATCTVGLSTGITASGLPVPLKGLLCLDMLLGRLEIVAFLVLFYPPTWIGKRKGGT